MSDKTAPPAPECFKQCPLLRRYVADLRETENRRLFMTRTVSDKPGTNLYKARCPLCGKTHRKRVWRISREEEMYTKLQRHFRHCEQCGKWVCKDCYLVINDLNGKEMCRECAKAIGANGMNDKQYDRYIRKHQFTNRCSYEDMREIARRAGEQQKEADALLALFEGINLHRPIDVPRTGCDPPADSG